MTPITDPDLEADLEAAAARLIPLLTSIADRQPEPDTPHIGHRWVDPDRLDIWVTDHPSYTRRRCP